MRIKITFTNGAVKAYNFVEDIRVEDGFLFFVARNDKNEKVLVANLMKSVVSITRD